MPQDQRDPKEVLQEFVNRMKSLGVGELARGDIDNNGDAAYVYLTQSSPDNSVTELQKFLNSVGFSMDADGAFGKSTQDAMREYNTQLGIDGDTFNVSTLEGLLSDDTASPTVAQAPTVLPIPGSGGEDPGGIPQHIFDFTMKCEGGYILHDVPGDPGGMTYAGIARNKWPVDDIWNDTSRLTKNPDDGIVQKVRRFYTKNFWDTIRLSEIEDENKAAVVYDFGVNGGSRTAIRAAQKVVYPDNENEWDGFVGTRTIVGINDMSRGDFVGGYKTQREAHYAAIIVAKKLNARQV